MKIRLLLQPTMAAIFAIRAGWKDAREGRPPYFWAVFTRPAHRHELLREGWKDLGKVFLIAVIIDLVYQFIVFRWFYPVYVLLVATLLAFLPYLLMIRGPLRSQPPSVDRESWCARTSAISSLSRRRRTACA